MDSKKCLDVIDETLVNLTEMNDINVLSSMTDQELESLLDDLQVLNSQLEGVLLGEMPLPDSADLEEVLQFLNK